MQCSGVCDILCISYNIVQLLAQLVIYWYIRNYSFILLVDCSAFYHVMNVGTMDFAAL